MNLPNKLTVFRFCCVPFLFAAALIQFRYHWIVTFIIYLLACLSDKADGIIARKHNLVTDFGKLMDPLADKSITLAAFLIMINLGWHTEIVIMIMMAREFLVAGIRMAATAEGEVIAANGFGKAKTLIQMLITNGVFLALAAYEIFGEEIIIATKGFNAPQWLCIFCTVSFWITAIVTFLSGIVYAKDGWHLIKTK